MTGSMALACQWPGKRAGTTSANGALTLRRSIRNLFPVRSWEGERLQVSTDLIDLFLAQYPAPCGHGHGAAGILAFLHRLHEPSESLVEYAQVGCGAPVAP